MGDAPLLIGVALDDGTGGRHCQGEGEEENCEVVFHFDFYPPVAGNATGGKKFRKATIKILS